VNTYAISYQHVLLAIVTYLHIQNINIQNMIDGN